MPYECASGSCSSCKGTLLNGAVDPLWPEATGLNERDRRKGDRILCCQARPVGDCTVQVRPAHVEGARDEPVPAPFAAGVEALERLVPGVIFIRCRPERPVPFLPGQFVLLQVPGGQRRAYSMANTDAGTLDFIVKEKPGGHASRYLFDALAPGDGLSLEGPYGRAYLRTPPEREMVCLAGGSGLAPILSVVRGALARPDAPAIRLFFGVNSADELFMADEMEALAAEHDRALAHARGPRRRARRRDRAGRRRGARGAGGGRRVRFLHGRAAGADRRRAQARHAERQGRPRPHLLRPLLLSSAPASARPVTPARHPG